MVNVTFDEWAANVPEIGKWVEVTDSTMTIEGLVVAHRDAVCPEDCPCDRLPGEQGIAYEVVDDEGGKHTYGDLSGARWEYKPMPKKTSK